jgi:hypothetical protein
MKATQRYQYLFRNLAEKNPMTRTIAKTCCAVVLSLGFSCEFHPCQSQEKTPDDWLEVLKNDPRLQARVTYNHFKARPNADAWFGVLQKATGAKFSIVPQAERGKVTFAVGSGQNVPAWKIMQSLAQKQVLEGKWEKTDDGYLLHGKPKSKTTGMAILTPEEEAEESAKLEGRNKAAANAPKVLFDLPKDHPLRVPPELRHKYAPKMEIKAPPDPPGPGPHHADPRLRQRISITLAKPKVDAALAKLADITKVRFSFADDIQNVRPATNGIFVNGVPAWQVMDILARAEQVDGHWVKDDDGYRLVPNGAEVPLPPEVVAAAEHRFQMEIIVGVGVLLTLAIIGFLFFKWRRVKRASRA